VNAIESLSYDKGGVFSKDDWAFGDVRCSSKVDVDVMILCSKNEQ